MYCEELFCTTIPKRPGSTPAASHIVSNITIILFGSINKIMININESIETGSCGNGEEISGIVCRLERNGVRIAVERINNVPDAETEPWMLLRAKSS